MKFSTPLPQPLPQECLKAAKIFRSFVTSGNNGLDKVIPHSVLQNAKGFAIFTVVKAGFLVSARAGSGIVIARLEDGSFSAPSAIGTAGMGFGGQAGAELTDFLIILNSSSAVKTFMSAGSLSLGGNMSLAIGPLGRNGEASGTLNTKGKVAAMYSYSKTKGLFGGVSLEGSVIVERQDANAIAYNSNVSAKQILAGNITPPYWAESLIQTLEACLGITTPGWVPDDPEGLGPRPNMARGYSFTGIGGSSGNDNKDTSKSKRMPSFSGSIIPGKLRKSSSRVDGSDSPPRDRDWSSSPSNSSPPRSAPPVSKAKPVKKPDPFDVFADGNDEKDDDDPWGDSPHFRPAVGYRSASVPLQPKNATQFPTHFESDFNDLDEEGHVPSRSQAPIRPLFNNTPKASNFDDLDEEGYIPARSQPPSVRPSLNISQRAAKTDPFPDLTTSMNAFGLAPSQTSISTQKPDRSWSLSPFKRAPSAPVYSWADKPMYRTQTPMSSSQRSYSPPTPPSSSAASHPPLSSKPVRQLSIRKGLMDTPPAGAAKAVALFDYNANEPGDLSFHEGDVIYVTEKTHSTNDWWTGVLATDTRTKGIFPANFVTLDI